MKRLIILLMIAAIGLVSCSKENSGKLEKDSPAYVFAKELASKNTYLNPDSNIVLISTTMGKTTAGDVITVIYDNFGNKIEQVKSMNGPRLKSMIEGIAEDITIKKVLKKKADDFGIKVTAEEVDSIIQKQYTQFGGEEKFTEFLKENGMDIEKVKKDMHDGVKIQKYIHEMLGKDIEVTEAEIDDMYKEDITASVRHILLMTKDKPEAEKSKIHKKIKSILRKAKRGADFAELAKKYSEDPGSKENGGLYKDFKKGSMVKPFEDAAFNVPIGELSDVVETMYGYHILKVIDRKKEERPRDVVKKALEENKERMAYQPFIAKVKEEVEFKKMNF